MAKVICPKCYSDKGVSEQKKCQQVLKVKKSSKNDGGDINLSLVQLVPLTDVAHRNRFRPFKTNRP